MGPSVVNMTGSRMFAVLVTFLFSLLPVHSDLNNKANNIPHWCTSIPTSENNFSIRCNQKFKNPEVNFESSSYFSFLEVMCNQNLLTKNHFQLLNENLKSPIKKISLFECPIPDTSFVDMIKNWLQVNDDKLKITDFEITGSDTDNINIHLNSTHFLNCENVHKISIKETNIKTLSEDVFQNTKLLKWIEIVKNDKLKYLPKNIFQNLTSLNFLDLHENSFVFIPDGIFSKLYMLEHLDLQGNAKCIGKKSDKLFFDLTNLVTLDLSNSIDGILPSEIFSNLHNLDSLNLNDTNIKTLHPEIFKNLLKLKFLYLKNASISTLPENLFFTHKSLTHLDLSLNYINSLPSLIFSNLHALVHLDISHNTITNLSPKTFNTLKILTFLNMSYLHLKSPLEPNIFSTLHELRYLDLSYNNLTEVPNSLFLSQNKLIELRLTGNKLISLPSLIFSTLENVGHLDLSHNNISALPLDVFANTTRLQRLDLDNNSLFHLDAEWWQHSSFLEYLSLQGNQINRIKVIDFLNTNTRSNFTVDLRNNTISIVDMMTSSNLNTNNVTFLLGHNPIDCENCYNRQFFSYLKNDTPSPLLHMDTTNLQCSDPYYSITSADHMNKCLQTTMADTTLFYPTDVSVTSSTTAPDTILSSTTTNNMESMTSDITSYMSTNGNNVTTVKPFTNESRFEQNSTLEYNSTPIFQYPSFTTRKPSISVNNTPTVTTSSEKNFTLRKFDLEKPHASHLESEVNDFDYDINLLVMIILGLVLSISIFYAVIGFHTFSCERKSISTARIEEDIPMICISKPVNSTQANTNDSFLEETSSQCQSSSQITSSTNDYVIVENISDGNKKNVNECEVLKNENVAVSENCVGEKVHKNDNSMVTEETIVIGPSVGDTLL